jgi:protein-S-isoprenylcysteine O-methyltransferase Ste14
LIEPRSELGRLWSSGVTRKTDHSVIITGPYGLVRHPIYFGIILATLVTAVIRGTAPGCVGAAFMVLGLFIKARIEERFLRSELGEERYSAYARRVPMLVPFFR